MAMSERHVERLTGNRVVLVEKMKIEPLFLAIFRKDDVLTGEMIERITIQPTRSDKVRYLLDFLVRRGGRAFNRLIEALKSTNQLEFIGGLCPETANIQDEESIKDIIHLVDAAPKDLTVIPMNDTETQNRDDLISAGRIYPTPVEKPHGRAVILTYGPETVAADTELLTTLFTDLHFDTKDYTCKQQMDVITQLLKERNELPKICEKLSIERFESFILFILGSRDDERLNSKQITSLFDGDQCPCLKAKPKIFFIFSLLKCLSVLCQAGGTKSIEEGLSAELDVANDSQNSRTQVTADVMADQLIVEYSCNTTSVGPVGDRFGRSMFIKSLAHSFAKHARESSIEALLGQVVSVTKELEKRIGDTSLELRQECRLRYDFYFCP